MPSKPSKPSHNLSKADLKNIDLTSCRMITSQLAIGRINTGQLRLKHRAKPTLKSYLALSIFMVLSACQSQSVPNSSSWNLAEYILERALSPQDEFNAQQFSNHLSKRASTQLQELTQAKLSDKSLGLLSISQNQKGTWDAFFAYQRRQWPLLLQLELESKVRTNQTSWQIQSFPFLGAYRQLAELIEPIGLSAETVKKNELKYLPHVSQALPWHGGLSGRDQRGRLQSSVVLVWAPPLVFVDGLALAGKANRKLISLSVSQAFAKRQRLAEQAQASYTQHVSLALPAGSSAQELIQLMSWMEGLGTQQLSLIVQSEQGPGLIYLGTRRSVQSLVKPQRLLHAKFAESSTTQPANISLYVRQSDQSKPERIKSALTEDPKTWNEDLFTIMERAQTRKLLHGFVVHPQAQTTVKDLIQLFDSYRSINQDLPLSIAPLTTANMRK